MRRHLAALTALTVSAAACASPHAAETPALTKDQAAKVLAHYQSVNNRANADLDAELLGTVETGAQLQMDRAAYRMRRAEKEKYPAFSYTGPAYYVPRLTGFPKWFVVAASTGKARHALLFTQDRAGAPWLLTADPFPARALSGVTVDKQGYATAVDPDDSKLPLAPGKVADAHAALLTKGTPGMAPGPYTTESRAALVKVQSALQRHGVTLASEFVPEGGRAFALRASGGGALVWYVLRQSESYKMAKAGVVGNGGDLTGLLTGRVRHNLDTTALIQYLALVPRQGGAQVIGTYRKAVHATGA